MSAKHKSNADKVEKYLYRCSMDPILKNSSLLRDFFSPQRDGDFKSTSERTDCSSRASSVSHEDAGSLSADVKSQSIISNDDDGNNDNAESIDSNPDVAKMWVPNPMHSVVSFSTRNSQQHQEEEEEEQEEDDEMEQDDIDIVDSVSNHNSDFPLDHLEMIKVLGKGCMGKVRLNYITLASFNNHPMMYIYYTYVYIGFVGKIKGNQRALCFEIHYQGPCDRST
jgi:hypothetical protein